MTGSVTGAPRHLLRAEGMAVLIAAGSAYAQTGASWWLFAMLFLAPDLSILGYLAGPRIGAICYNATHSYLLPLGFCAWGLVHPESWALALGLIWAAHVGLDRMLGFGLKYAADFKASHLGWPEWGLTGVR
ncbi:MAG: DUF4260 domain-containing protein [Sphingomonadaceae bacterium]